MPLNTRDQIKQKIRDDGVEYLLVQFVDINGAPKVKLVPSSHLDDVIDDGAGFAGAAVLGMGQGPNSHDMLARVDLDSYTPVPWRDGFARLASDLYVDEQPYMFCSRQNAKRILAKAKDKGYILDLRSNPGGLLSQAVKVSDIFLKRGEIVSTREKDKKNIRRNEVFKGTNRMSAYGPFEVIMYLGDAMGDFEKTKFNNNFIFPNPMYGKW